MTEQKKEQLKALLIIFSAVLVSYKLPHDSYSLSKFILRPIKLGEVTIFLSGLIPLVLFIIGIKKHLKLERYKNRGKLMPFVFVLIIILPLMRGSIDFVRTQYYSLTNQSLYSVDITDSSIHLHTDETEPSTTVNVNLKIIGYDKRLNTFKVRVYLPNTLSELTEIESFELDGTYETFGGPQNVRHIQYSKTFKLSSENIADEIFYSNWYREGVIYEIFNEDQSVKIINRGY